MVGKKKVEKKKRKKVLDGKGIIDVKLSFNNTIVNLKDSNKKTLTIVSAGNIGYRNTEKVTPFSTKNIVKKVIEEVIEFGIKEVELQLKGISPMRNIMIEEFFKYKDSLSINEISDKTPVTFNGVKPKNQPRK